MHKITTSIHSVKSVEYGNIKQIKCGSFVLDILVTDRDGQRFELTIFSDEAERLVFTHNPELI